MAHGICCGRTMPVLTPGGVQITSPGFTSRLTPPSSCSQPVPSVMIRILTGMSMPGRPRA